MNTATRQLSTILKLLLKRRPEPMSCSPELACRQCGTEGSEFRAPMGGLLLGLLVATTGWTFGVFLAMLAFVMTISALAFLPAGPVVGRRLGPRNMFVMCRGRGSC